MLYPPDSFPLDSAKTPATAALETYQEITRLTRQLHDTQQRLQELAGCELDSVLPAGPQTFLLHDTEERLRESEAAQRDLSITQASILAALPAHIALIDREGVILSINRGWGRFGETNGLQNQEATLGRNYLKICEDAQGECAAEAHQAGAGIRSVLEGKQASFAMEYPCHSPSEQRWFRLMVNALEKQGPGRAIVMHIDVSDRKQAEDSVRLLSSAVYQSKESIVITDADLDLPGPRIIFVNPAYTKMTGYTREEAIGKTPRVLQGPRTSKSVLKRLRKNLERGEVFSGETINYRKDGTEFYIEWQVAPILDAQGKTTHFVAIQRDVSERKQAETILAESQERLALATESAYLGIWDWDIAGDKMVWDKRMIALYGLREEEFKGVVDDWQKGLHPEDRSRAINEVGDALKGKKDFNSQFRVVWPNGEVRIMEGHALVQRAANGSPIRMTGVNRDITETKKAEQRLVEQAALIDETRDAIIVRDLNHRISFWSLGAERLYGWTQQEARGCIVNELVKVDSEKFAEADLVVKKTGHWYGELQKTAKNGTLHTLDARWTLMRDAKGKPVSILSIDTDITERKKLEQQFLRSQRMESIGTLAGGIAHDLNNSLGPILMSIELLKMKMADSDCLELLEKISTSAQHSAGMVRQLLSFARGVEGRRIEVQVKHLLHDIEKIVGDTFLKHIQLKSTVPKDLWTVQGDPTQLHQVLLNLCVNARDAMPNGGSLTLSAENVTLDEQFAAFDEEAKPGPYVGIRVEDNGDGMTPEIIEKIFDPFFTTKELGKGTGLGLSTTLGIVKSHDGFIRVYSEPGKGTKFQIYLPAKTELTPEILQEQEMEMPRGGGELILVVDDEISVREITQRTLEAFGYRVVVASDGAEAVAVYSARSAEIALVLTDMMMPGIDGPTAIQILLRLNPKLPIIAASGLSTESQIARVTMLGVRHFLPKPYTASTMLKKLREALFDA